MKFRKLRPLVSSLLSAAILLSACFGLVVSVSAAISLTSPGDDGSAVMNETYAAHTSLVPIGPSFNIPSLLAWTPESDPDARYNRASIALPEEKRVTGFVVNPKANPEAKLMLCSLANPDHDGVSAQGTENFMRWSFNYWQYVDSFVYWSGSEEGIICCPTAEFIDAAHKNGVPVVATLGFPWGRGTNYAEQVDEFCRKASDGSFPVADKLLQLMDYYGFDGYFFNQESYGSNGTVAQRLNEMMRYMHKKNPNILISWYDSMKYSSAGGYTAGGVGYHDGMSSADIGWMTPDADGYYGVDEFMANYNWYYNGHEVDESRELMTGIGRSPFDVFFGLNVQMDGMNTNTFADNYLLDNNGLLKGSLALYCPNSTLGFSTSGENFHETERTFYVNSASDPRVEVSDPSIAGNNSWVGMSRFFADKTAILKAPFVTSFNSGHGRSYWVDGVRSRSTEWSYQSIQDIMPTWQWIIDSNGTKLSGAYDFTDAYNGGNSIKFSGTLTAGQANSIMLYSTDIDIGTGYTMSLTYKVKNADSNTVKLTAYYEKAGAVSYAASERVVYTLTGGTVKNGWTTASVDLESGKKLIAIGIEISSGATVQDYQVNLGQIKVLEGNRPAAAAPSGFTLDNVHYNTAQKAEARIYWNAVPDAAYYEVYQVTESGDRFIMSTPGTALYIPTLERPASSTFTLKIISVNVNGERGTAASSVSFKWEYGADASEPYEALDAENLCLNKTVVSYSGQLEAEPASKAVDGTSDNGSKWCIDQVSSGWMVLDIGDGNRVQRWRIEHAEYGGEDNSLNTRDFSLLYWTGGGVPTGRESTGWATADSVTGNTDAVTDRVLNTPITARYWKLNVTRAYGNTAFAALRIYEWQMFDTDRLNPTEPVPMNQATATNNRGAADVFVLNNVPKLTTVKVYRDAGSGSYILLGSGSTGQTAGTVTVSNIDFSTDDKDGFVWYTTTSPAQAESPKSSCRFYRVGKEVSPQLTNVSFEKFSQPGSNQSSDNAGGIYTTLTVNGVAEGDVVYVYEGTASNWTKMSLPAAAGQSRLTINGVLVTRAGGTLRLQIKRQNMAASPIYTVSTPKFAEPTATVRITAKDGNGRPVSGVSIGIYPEGSSSSVWNAVTGTNGIGTAALELGTYSGKVESVPNGYNYSGGTVTKIIRTEGQIYDIELTFSGGAWGGLTGDVNSDGKVSMDDSLLVLRYALSLISDDDLDLNNADADGNDTVNSVDALIVMRCALGLIK